MKNLNRQVYTIPRVHVRQNVYGVLCIGKYPTHSGSAETVVSYYDHNIMISLSFSGYEPELCSVQCVG